MNFEEIIQDIVSIAGAFSLKLVIFLFLICSIGEFGLFSIPYILETIWLLSGYNLGSGVLSSYHMILLWLVAQAGRQTGAFLLYYLAQFGSMPLKKLYRRYFEARVSNRLSGNNAMLSRFSGGISCSSPFSIALGRLFGLRVPITLTLGATKRWRTLLLGVLLSSLVWDGIYILLGLAGGQTILRPTQMMIYSLIGLTILYAVTLAVRQRKWRQLPRDIVKN